MTIFLHYVALKPIRCSDVLYNSLIYPLRLSVGFINNCREQKLLHLEFLLLTKIKCIFQALICAFPCTYEVTGTEKGR